MQHKKSYQDDVGILRWLQPRLTLKPLREITRDVVGRIAEEKRLESSPARANRITALIRAILRRSEIEWEWLDKAPAVRMYQEANRRVRWITPEQVQTLLRELPKHQVDVVLFALATGLRQSNVVKLEWSEVDLKRGVAWIHADQAKAGKDIHVSLNSVALEVLARQVGKHPARVFTYKGRPFGWANTKGWRDALKRAGIENFRWHDLRHTWASWHAQNGTPLHVLQEMGGWETASMVRRYAHLAPAHLQKYAETVAGLLGGTNSTQPPVIDKGLEEKIH
jgi:integrase